MEKTSEYGVLGPDQSCWSEERIEVLSDSIERDHSSQNTSKLIVFRKLLGWKLDTSYTKKFLHVTSASSKDLPETWLDERELGSEDAQRPEGQVVQQFKSSQSNQPSPNPDHDRMGQPVVRTDRTGATRCWNLTREPCKMEEKTSRSRGDRYTFFSRRSCQKRQNGATRCWNRKQPKHVHLMTARALNVEDKLAHDRTGRPVVSCHTSNVPDGSQTRSSHENTSFNVGDEKICDRTGQPVVNRDETGHEQTMLNEVNMDFRIPGLPHSVVKQAESSRVGELVKKIENHTDRHALQQDLQQNKAYNPFSATVKTDDSGRGQHRAVWIVRDRHLKTQCKACLSYWSEGIVYCTCGHLLKETVANRSFIMYTLDLLSIPEYVNQEGKTSWPQIWGNFQKTKNIIKPIIWKRDASKRQFKGIHDRFLRDHVFRERMHPEQSRWRCLSCIGTFLQNKITPIRMSESEYFHYRQNWWITLNKSWKQYSTIEKTFWLQPSVVYFKTVYTKKLEDNNSGRCPTGNTKKWKPASSSSSNLVAMERILVVFLRIQRKSLKEDASKGLRSNGDDPLFTELWRKPQTNGFYEFILFFVTDRSFTADGGLL